MACVCDYLSTLPFNTPRGSIVSITFFKSSSNFVWKAKSIGMSIVYFTNMLSYL